MAVGESVSVSISVSVSVSARTLCLADVLRLQDGRRRQAVHVQLHADGLVGARTVDVGAGQLLTLDQQSVAVRGGVSRQRLLSLVRSAVCGGGEAGVRGYCRVSSLWQ